jgi:rhodanese-related sulfurtransferase
MNHITKYIATIALSGLLLSCGNHSNTNKENSLKLNESAILYDFIEKSGDIINSDEAPFTIGADEVFEELSKILVIDTRDTTDYFAGHIDGAIRVEAQSLISFLEEKVNVSTYDKIVITCYSGQSAAYYTTLLRLAGYSNVYTLRYGMAGWSNKVKPNRILDNLSNKYAGILETKVNTPNKKYDFPKISTGETGGCSILKARVKALFEEGFGKAHIKIDSIVKHCDKYFIINYWQAEDYVKGHLPGAFQYTPKESLNKKNMLLNLPNDKPIVVYCTSGQNSASVVAFLRVLGYNANSISFGTNGFMHSFMLTSHINAFNPSENVANYLMVEGKNPSLNTAKPSTNSDQEVKADKTPAVVPTKKKQKTGGGGC